MKDGIEKYMDFSGPREPDTRRVKITELDGKAIEVLAWEVRKSRFSNNDTGLFAMLTGKFIDTGERWVLNTGSSIIREQLGIIEKAKLKEGNEDMSFSCQIVKRGKFCKMIPLEVPDGSASV